MSERRIRVVIAKIGLDGHDRGAKVVARYLRDAGMEVIFTGQRQTADQVAVIAVQEDADLVGLSFLAGDHMVLVPKVIQKLKEQSKEDAVVLVGGIIPKRHEPELLQMGVAKVFYAGTDPNEIVKYVKENVLLRD